MIRRSTRHLVLALIVLCLFAAAVIRLTGSPASAPTLQRAMAAESNASVPASAPDAVATQDSPPPHALPDRRFTPGAANPDVTQDNIVSTICVPGFTRSIRPPAQYTSHLKREQLDDPERGYEDHNMRDFEEDHDVPLEAGGNATDPRNLWPEPLHGPWNAHMKDRLENRIHELICAHAITLAEGQAAFLGNWTTAYRRFVER